MNAIRLLLVSVSALLLSACVQVPENVEPVTGFDAERYLGTWYEIARLDHRFERNMEQVTATYSWREDGGVRVLNRGFDTEKAEWEDAEGRAYFVEDKATGFLKVSFFGPFFGSYIVFGLDDDYQHAFISGPDTSYLWLLSREPRVDDGVKQEFLAQAAAAGFPVEDLIWVSQE